jgi:hypothetical protein
MIATAERTFTALMRWRGPDPTIEIETSHPGFATPENAALFANGFSPNTPVELRLWSDSTLDFLLASGDYVRWHGGDVKVWALAPAAGEPIAAIDSEFEAKPFADFRFPATAFGDYRQTQYAVLDQKGNPIDLVVDWDEKSRLRITVPMNGSDEELRALFSLGVKPEA